VEIPATQLIEGGFLSNPREAALIASADYRHQLTQAVASALGLTPRP
jgi:N-acetylmuramoyl-L-alanine amidase